MTHDALACETLHDMMDPARARAALAALSLPGEVEIGTPLPPFFHQFHFWSAVPPDGLGRDGHPARGSGLVPDLGLPRRMWAGGRLEFLAPLRAGHPAQKTSTLVDVARKSGRSGPLAFVTLCHEIRQGDTLCLREYQDLVYRDDPDATVPQPAAAPPRAPGDADVTRAFAPDSTLLFRYSALTFNGHRIHYDATYAREVEGYGGLVVHGPLLAQMLVLLAAEQLGRLRAFSFRATSALTLPEHASLCWRADGTLWVAGPDGRQCMQARAE